MAENSQDQIRQRIEQYDENRSGFIIHFTVFLIINVILWGIWAFMGSLIYPWPAIVSLGWGAGLVAHAIDMRSKRPGLLAQVDRETVQAMEELYGPDWRDLADDEMYQRFYDAAYQRLRHNTEFSIHLAVFVTIIAAIWVAWALFLRSVVWLPLIITGGWGAGLGAHAISNYFNPSRRIMATEKAVQEAMSGSPVKKKKRLQQAHAILTDDGELLEIVDDPQEAQRYEHQE